jgi:hypothetical protein
MYVVIIDVPYFLEMLFSNKWAANLGGCFQMNLSYATIPTWEGTYITLHPEKPKGFM